MDNNELMHYGILGMRWGVRRTEAQLAKARGKVSELEEKLNRKTGGKSTNTPPPAPRKRRLSELSDAELSEKIRRLEMEKRYSDLTRKEEKSSKGKAFVMDILEKSGKNIGTQLVTYVAGTVTNKALAKAFNDPAVVNPKKGQKDK